MTAIKKEKTFDMSEPRNIATIKALEKFGVECIEKYKKLLSEKIETFEKSFIETLDDRKDKIYKEAKNTEDEMMISNLSGEVNAIFWIRNKIIEELKQFKKDLMGDKD